MSTFETLEPPAEGVNEDGDWQAFHVSVNLATGEIALGIETLESHDRVVLLPGHTWKLIDALKRGLTLSTATQPPGVPE